MQNSFFVLECIVCNYFNASIFRYKKRDMYSTIVDAYLKNVVLS